jgi:hypothetical protein
MIVQPRGIETWRLAKELSKSVLHIAISYLATGHITFCTICNQPVDC